MTIRYVGIGGNDSNSGLSWALRKLTLSGAEATPVVAGDTVYVGPGTYRETLTVGVSGTNGNPITYIGDYLGTNTNGVGGAIRITGSAEDIALTRSNCIVATSKDYRTFSGFLIDGASSNPVRLNTSCGNWIIKNCQFQSSGTTVISINGTGINNTVRNCVFFGSPNGNSITFSHTVAVDNSGHIVDGCIIVGGAQGVNCTKVGGVVCRNSTFFTITNQAFRSDSFTAGQTTAVNNCIIFGCTIGFQATNSGEITEDYNNVVACTTARTNASTGAHSLADLTMFDSRWFFNLVFRGAGPNSFLQLVTPFDLASDSPLVNVAGTSPTTTDMRGTAIQGAQREWGALEMDSTLKIIGGLHKNRVEEMR